MYNLKSKFSITLIFAVLALFNACSNNNYNFNKFDPIEPINKKIFCFNQITDEIIFKPSIKTYNRNIPTFVRNIIDNFFFNLTIIPTITNNILRGDFFKVPKNSMQLFLNSSIGIFGLFDVGYKFDLTKEESTFSDTIIHYGYNTPFYFMMPFLGPSTMMTFISFLPDYFFNPQSILNHNYKKYLFWGVLFNKKIQLLEKQAIINMSYIDRYACMRNAYLQYNKFNIQY